ncbi:MAG: hypothetical protein J6B56_03955 [Clostridia bacterium]|nr:hypothetical protein [Clostridia bacterium]
MLELKNKIIKGLNLQKQIECVYPCYLLSKKRYILFYDELITKQNIEELLKNIDENCKSPVFSEWKTIIVVGKTLDVFNKKDLLYFNGINTFVCFYLINDKTGDHYMNDQWIFVLGLNYRKYIRMLKKLLKQ